MKKLILLASSAVIFPTAAFAQSTGSQDFEEQAIVITGSRTQDVGGVQAPDTPKARAVLTQEMIARQNPGQTILDTINVIPGVSFQNNDAYGSSGGTLTVRGFDSSRVSLTFDGMPLNDSGNYAIYSNQQLDPEIIDQVNVSLGSTDVDSPTASAAGGTINYRSRIPGKTFGGRIVGSLGEYDYRRIFAMIDTGEIGPWGTTAFVSVSNSKNDNPFDNYGVVDKQQFNAKIYQPLGNGDFISIAGHYNRNRNNFFGSSPLRNDTTQSGTSSAPRVVGPNSGNRFPRNNDEREYDINYPCLTDTPQAGVSDVQAPAPANQASCGTEFNRRYNPSDTGNIRLNSRFALSDQLTLTVDSSFQSVKANGGGTILGREGFRRIGTTNYTGFIGGQYYFNRDLNGDGDILDTCAPAGASCATANTNGVTLLSPSQTRTKRYGLIAGLRYQINDDHTVRAGYTLDHANHRQTGEVGFVDRTGEPFDVFPVNDPIADGNGFNVQKRDRQSYAILHQGWGEYIGSFFDKRLTVNIGGRLPFFTRDLEQNCFTTSASGFIDCFGGNEAQVAAYAAANPYNAVINPTTGAITVTGFAPPGRRKLKYDKFLPNIGGTFDITPRLSAFANYAKGLSVPGTDNLYNSFYFPADSTAASPVPETTNNFDAGLRYRSSKIQAQIAVWKSDFKDRSASAFDPELLQTVYRNLGTVNKWGLDGSVSYEPIRNLTLYAFGSLNRSKIQDNIQTGSLSAFPANSTCDTISPTTPQQIADATRACAFTAGQTESGVPKYTYGFSAKGSVGPVDLGVTAKRTGPRYVYDTNLATFRGDIGVPGATPGRVIQEEIYGATAPAYWLVNLDARFNMQFAGLKDTYFQLNVYNAFNKFYVGGFGGGLSQATSTRTCNATSTPSCVPTATVGTFGAPGFVQIGAPRTISGSLSIAF